MRPVGQTDADTAREALAQLHGGSARFAQTFGPDHAPRSPAQADLDGFPRAESIHTIPLELEESCRGEAAKREWLTTLPNTIDLLRRRWGLSCGDPFPSQAAWVAPAQTVAGSQVVLKLGMPHFEGRDELQGLRFWKGDPTVQLLAHDGDLNAMLLERCDPGTPLRELPEAEQDTVIAGLLRRLWRRPQDADAFRPLSAMLAYWSSEAMDNSEQWSDETLVLAALSLFDELPRTGSEEVLLATDLHAGNVLRAKREPWLVIDPKPFLGDPAYAASQHLLAIARLLAA